MLGSRVSNTSDIFAQISLFSVPGPIGEGRSKKKFTMYVAYFYGRSMQKQCSFRMTVGWI
jgi:hypothetical protein